jgi:hypothetical protein
MTHPAGAGKIFDNLDRLRLLLTLDFRSVILLPIDNVRSRKLWIDYWDVLGKRTFGSSDCLKVGDRTVR